MINIIAINNLKKFKKVKFLMNKIINFKKKPVKIEHFKFFLKKLKNIINAKKNLQNYVVFY